jgi:flagellar basal body-associated protein FliL
MRIGKNIKKKIIVLILMVIALVIAATVFLMIQMSYSIYKESTTIERVDSNGGSTSLIYFGEM